MSSQSHAPSWLDYGKGGIPPGYAKRSKKAFEETCESLGLSTSLEPWEEDAELTGIEVAFSKMFGGYFGGIDFSSTLDWGEEIDDGDILVGVEDEVVDDWGVESITDPLTRSVLTETYNKINIQPIITDIKKLKKRAKGKYFCPECDNIFHSQGDFSDHKKKSKHCKYC